MGLGPHRALPGRVCSQVPWRYWSVTYTQRDHSGGWALIWILIGVSVLIVGVVAVVFIRRRKGSDDTMVSVVMLRSTPSTFTADDIRRHVRGAIGLEPQVNEIPFPDGRGSAFFVTSEQIPPFSILQCSKRYFPEELNEETAARMEDPRARRAVHEHTAWTSVDAHHGMKRMPDKQFRYEMYSRLLGIVAARLADEHCMMFYLPADDRVGDCTPENIAALGRGNPAAVFEDDDMNAPVIRTDADDERINAAMAEANRRLPELIAAFERDGTACSPIVKAKFIASNGQVEYMWGELLGVEPSGLRIEIVNRPNHDGVPGRGAIIVVPSSQIVDWAYAEKGKAHGMFVEKLLNKAVASVM